MTRDRRVLKAPVWLFSVGILLVGTTAACAGSYSLEAPSPERIPELEEQVGERPADAALLTQLGASYRQVDRLDDARQTLERALEIDPLNAPASFFLALTAEDQEDLTRARDLYDAISRLDAPPGLQERAEQRLALVRRKILVSDVRRSLEREQEMGARALDSDVLAVFPFRYSGTSPDYEPLGRALAELLVSDLSQIDRLRVLERLRVQLLLDEIALGEAGLVDPGTASRSGRILGAGQVVQGELGGTTERIELNALVVSVSAGTGEIDDPVTASAQAEQFIELEKDLAFGIIAELGIQLTPAERERIEQRPTRNLQALLAFGRGLEARDAGDFQRAASEFRQAAEIDGGFEAAGEAASTAEAESEASTESTQDAAVAATTDLAPPEVDLGEIEILVPTPEPRDPVPDATGSESVTPGLSRTILRILVRRPGGDG